MFSFDAETGKINMYGIIGDEITAEDLMGALEAIGGKDVTIRLQSEGGEITTGLSMANHITDYPGKVTVIVDALAGSIATVFPMAADQVLAYENSTIVIHKAMTMAAGNSIDMRMTADILDMWDGKIAASYANKSGRSQDFFLELMRTETWFTAAQAENIGLIDGIMTDSEHVTPSARFSPVATLDVEKFVAQIAPSMALLPVAQARPRLSRSRVLLQSMNLSLR